MATDPAWVLGFDEMGNIAGGPGETLRAVRRRNNWTLADVAARAGIPLSTLSKIENGQVSPTYDQLVRLSESLGMDISELFSRQAGEAPPSGAGGRRSINRLGNGQIFETDSRVQCYLSTDLLNKQFTPIISEAKAHTLEDFGEFMSHQGEEFLYVVDGALELHTDCYAPVVLQTGESIYFDSTMGHAYVAHGEGNCKFLVICTVPSESHKMSRQAEAAPRVPAGSPSASRSFAKSR